MRILTALSGGVDSAVAAARLLREGAEVVAVHLRLGVEADGASAGGARSCCGLDDARDARSVARRLGVPFYVVDVREAFADVIEDFVATYAAGRTPNPCVRCNVQVKFGRLGEIAEQLGCEAVATGHYARRETGPGGRLRLLRAADRKKDQSYVLYGLDQRQLARARFPLGSMHKAAVRVEARALGLRVADKRESQDLCFAPHGDYRRFLREQAPHALVPGEIVDEGGRALGRHDGAAAFTVGQRRGLPAVGAPRYVSRVHGATGRVEVAPREAVLRHDVTVGAVNWIEEPTPEEIGRTWRVEARIRHAAPPAPATLTTLGARAVRARFDRGAFAPAPGQALVAYVGDAVLCGGRILEAE